MNILRDIKNYYRQIGFAKENSSYSMKHQKTKGMLLFATKLTEKSTNASNAKEYHKFYLQRKKHKIGKTIKNNYSATKNL